MQETGSQEVMSFCFMQKYSKLGRFRQFYDLLTSTILPTLQPLTQTTEKPRE